MGDTNIFLFYYVYILGQPIKVKQPNKIPTKTTFLNAELK